MSTVIQQPQLTVAMIRVTINCLTDKRGFLTNKIKRLRSESERIGSDFWIKEWGRKQVERQIATNNKNADAAEYELRCVTEALEYFLGLQS